MRLAEFILRNREPILAEWEAFARTCTPASGAMDITALRDHANEMLTVIAADLATPQAGDAQAEKSKGNAPSTEGEMVTAAEEHGAGRAESGFTMEQMVSEYRALRASVIRLWVRGAGRADAGGRGGPHALQRGHRPVAGRVGDAVHAGAGCTRRRCSWPSWATTCARRWGRSSPPRAFMLDTQGAAGALPHAHHAHRQQRHAHGAPGGRPAGLYAQPPGRGHPHRPRADEHGQGGARRGGRDRGGAPGTQTIEIDARGELDGEWDCARISQVLANLIGNALEHGSTGRRVTVVVGGDDEEVCMAVAQPRHRHPGRPAERDLQPHEAPRAGSQRPRQRADGEPGAGPLHRGAHRDRARRDGSTWSRRRPTARRSRCTCLGGEWRE